MQDQSITVLVPLTRGKVAIIDAEDAERILAFTWHATAMGYAARKRQRRDGPGPHLVYMHRFILGVDDGVHVDHADGNTLNNRRSNLREATPQQNQRNRGAQRNSKSGYKGVSWHKQTRKWAVRIKAGGSYRHVGLFEDVIEAARAYDAVAREAFGEYAWLNFPDDH